MKKRHRALLGLCVVCSGCLGTEEGLAAELAGEEGVDDVALQTESLLGAAVATRSQPGGFNDGGAAAYIGINTGDNSVTATLYVVWPAQQVTFSAVSLFLSCRIGNYRLTSHETFDGATLQQGGTHAVSDRCVGGTLERAVLNFNY